MSPTTTHPTVPSSPPDAAVPPLRHGDRLSCAEFERRYDAMPGLKKAELLDGVVYMPPPVGDDHGSSHFNLISWLGYYAGFTPGVSGSDNGSIRLAPSSMPQPDAFLRVLETHGGQSSRGSDGYIAGAPELVAEVAVSSADFDLNVKQPFYARAGVLEYLVWRVLDREMDWFVLRGAEVERLALTPPGWYRSEAFPGLCLDPQALLRQDFPALLGVLQQGINGPEHAEFVKRLQDRAATPRP